MVSQQPSPIFYLKIPSDSYHVAMVRGRPLGPQWLIGQGVTPVISSDGLKQIKQKCPGLNLMLLTWGYFPWNARVQTGKHTKQQFYWSLSPMLTSTAYPTSHGNWMGRISDNLARINLRSDDGRTGETTAQPLRRRTLSPN